MASTRTAYIEKLEKDKPNGRCRKWRLWVRLSTGRKRSRRFTGTYREAQAALVDFRAEVDAETPDAGAFGPYADAWLDGCRASGDYEVSTLDAYRCCVDALKVEFADDRVSALTPQRCREGLASIRNGNNRSGRVLSGAYMHKIYSTMNMVLDQAETDGIIARNPLRNVKPPKVDTAERDWLSPDELGALVRGLSTMPVDGRVVACALIACLGLRRGEACGMYVEDIDLDAGIAHVRRSYKQKERKVGRPKTGAGVRDLPMPPELVGIIRRWLVVRDERGWSDRPHLACSTHGTLLNPSKLFEWWKGIRDGYGGSGMGLHQLRHSNLSMMARHMNVFDLQRWAGWASIGPAKIYVHADDESLAAGAADAFWHHFGTENGK